MVNDGKALEAMIDLANRSYKKHGIASVHKIPTPTKVLKQVDGRITDGYFEQGEFVDYLGMVKGNTIVFDAKSTIGDHIDIKNNLAPHQLAFMRQWKRQGAICFLVIGFVEHGRYYVLGMEAVERYYSNIKETGVNMSLKQVAINGSVIKSGAIPFDYLKALGVRK